MLLESDFFILKEIEFHCEYSAGAIASSNGSKHPGTNITCLTMWSAIITNAECNGPNKRQDECCITSIK